MNEKEKKYKDNVLFIMFYLVFVCFGVRSAKIVHLFGISSK